MSSAFFQQLIREVGLYLRLVNVPSAILGLVRVALGKLNSLVNLFLLILSLSVFQTVETKLCLLQTFERDVLVDVSGRFLDFDLLECGCSRDGLEGTRVC